MLLFFVCEFLLLLLLFCFFSHLSLGTGVYVCMYVCIDVCMCICIYVCISMYI